MTADRPAVPQDAEETMPKVRDGCCVCKVTPEDVKRGSVVVSPSGIAHHTNGWESTVCGHYAAGPGWWLPL